MSRMATDQTSMRVPCTSLDARCITSPSCPYISPFIVTSTANHCDIAFLMSTSSNSEVLVEGKVVVVLGPAAAGKTTFINLATDRGDSGVGHGIGPGTIEVEWVRPPHLIHGHNIIFIDTPGFDDAERQDAEIMTMIMESLVNAKLRLDTILYLHPISDNRILCSAVDRLRLLTSLWKIDRAPNVIIATTMWEEVDEEVGVRREKQLKSKFWAELIANGCEVKRFHGTTQSALDVIRPKKVVIVVGPAAAGKTTFINLLTDRGDHGIGHDIVPGTTGVEWIAYSQQIEGHGLIFMDTPGLDDAEKSDRETVIMIKESLKKANRKPDIILYLHPISSNRMPRSELKRLKLLMDSWEIERVPNAVIVTTMWNEVQEEVGARREEQLKSTFWADLIANGCEVKQFRHTPESALEILRLSLAKTGIPHVPAQKSVPSKGQTKSPRKELSILQRLLRELFQRILNNRRIENRTAVI